MNATATDTFTFTHDLRVKLANALFDAIQDGVYGDHQHYLSVLQHTRPGTVLPVTHDLADALVYFGIREF